MRNYITKLYQHNQLISYQLLRTWVYNLLNGLKYIHSQGKTFLIQRLLLPIFEIRSYFGVLVGREFIHGDKLCADFKYAATKFKLSVMDFSPISTNPGGFQPNLKIILQPNGLQPVKF